MHIYPVLADQADFDDLTCHGEFSGMRVKERP